MWLISYLPIGKIFARVTFAHPTHSEWIPSEVDLVEFQLKIGQNTGKFRPIKDKN
jgi:hypothetical protein